MSHGELVGTTEYRAHTIEVFEYPGSQGEMFRACFYMYGRYQDNTFGYPTRAMAIKRAKDVIDERAKEDRELIVLLKAKIKAMGPKPRAKRRTRK